MTARAQGRPWDMGKNFSYSAPVGTVHQVEDVDLDSAELSLTVNGVSAEDSTYDYRFPACNPDMEPRQRHPPYL
jgi:2-keto-4-pentenoate hydratase/2-oxohepta-3-ene-1,7-dioic acid hydratase in catechol pathway